MTMHADLNTGSEGGSSDDVAAAFRAAESASPAPSTPAPAPSTPAPATPNAPVRAPDGRFAPATAAPPGAPTPQTATPAGTPPASAPPAPAGTVPGAPTAPGQPAALTLDPSRAPQGWRPEMKEKWGTLPEDVRGEIIRREEASAQGVQRLREHYAPLDELDTMLETHAPYFEQIGRDPGEYFSEVIQIEQTLTLGNPAQKMQTLLDLGEQYGIPLRQVLDSAMGGQLDAVMQQSHQQWRTPPTLPAEVQRELQELRQNQQQLVQGQADQQLQVFLSTNRPFFDEVADDMADLIDNGLAKTYEEAYDLAVWRNPQTRARSYAVANGQQQLTAVQQRQQLAAQVVTPPSASIQSAPQSNANTSTEDDIRAAWNAQVRGSGVV